jgi:23S rRNA (guanosine2251-2'-O)-methyltransferase
MTDINFSPKVILILGSEETGLRKTTKDVCDEFVAIPSTDTSSSLNVATAGGIAMYEVRRQQKKI